MGTSGMLATSQTTRIAVAARRDESGGIARLVQK
jgi:hypothetical protein